MNVEYSLLAGGAAAGAYVYYTQSGGLPLDPTGTLLIGALGAFVWEYASIAWKVGSARPGRVLGEFVNEVVQETVQDVPMVINVIIAQMPTIINAVLKEFPLIMDAVLDAVPKVVDATLKVAPRIVESVVAEVPKVVVAVAKETPVLVKEVIKEIPTIVEAIAGAGVAAVTEVAEAAGEGLAEGAKVVGQAFIDVFDPPKGRPLTWEDKLRIWDIRAAGPGPHNPSYLVWTTGAMKNAEPRPSEEVVALVRQYVALHQEDIRKAANTPWVLSAPSPAEQALLKQITALESGDSAKKVVAAFHLPQPSQSKVTMHELNPLLFR